MDLSKRVGELAEKCAAECGGRYINHHAERVAIIEAAIKQAVREALAEPDEEMMVAGWDACEECTICISQRADPRAAWNAMAAIRLREK